MNHPDIAAIRPVTTVNMRNQASSPFVLQCRKLAAVNRVLSCAERQFDFDRMPLAFSQLDGRTTYRRGKAREHSVTKGKVIAVTCSIPSQGIASSLLPGPAIEREGANDLRVAVCRHDLVLDDYWRSFAQDNQLVQPCVAGDNQFPGGISLLGRSGRRFRLLARCRVQGSGFRVQGLGFTAVVPSGSVLLEGAAGAAGFWQGARVASRLHRVRRRFGIHMPTCR